MAKRDFKTFRRIRKMALMWCLLLSTLMLPALGNLNDSSTGPPSLGGKMALHPHRSRGPCFPNPCLRHGSCKVIQGRPNCTCNPGFSGLFCQDVEVKLQCEEGYMKMMVRQEVFDLMKIPLASVHLRNKKCKVSQQYEGGAGFLGAKLTGENHTACGSVIQVNGSHVSYTNVMESEQETNKVITRTVLTRLNFSCIYAYKRVVGLSSPLRAMAEIAQSAVKEGDFSVTMSLYENASYEQAYPQHPPRFFLTDTLYILLKIEGQDQVKYFFLGVEDCWSTPTSDPNHNTRHELIMKGCPLDMTVTFLGEIGTSTEAKFSFQMFRFTNFSQLYLHCKVRLCTPDNAQPCIKECPSKQKGKRALANSHRDVVSYGPIHILTPSSLKVRDAPFSGTFWRLQVWIAGAGLSVGMAATLVLAAAAKAMKK